MLGKRHYGSLSLGLATSGFVVVEIARHRGWIGGDGATLAAAAFEAGTIGGVADWFAVSALFHHVPIPILGRHTDIIVRQRARITENIVDMVEEKWLAPEVIGAQLGRLVNVASLLTWLDDPARRAQGAAVAKHLIAMLARQLESAEAAPLLARLLSDQLAAIDIARPLGTWIEHAITSGEHDAAWNALLRAADDHLEDADTLPLVRGLVRDALAACLPSVLDRLSDGPGADALVAELKRVALGLDLSQPLGAWLGQALARRDHDPLSEAVVDALRADLSASAEFRTLIEGLVREAVERWKGRGWKERLLGGGAEALGAIRYDRIAEDVHAAIDAALADARTNERNPIRQKLDATLATFAQRLSAGDPALAQPVRVLAAQLIERVDLKALLARLAAWAKEAAARPAGEGPSLIDEEALAGTAIRAMRMLIVDLRRRDDHPLRAHVDAAVLDFARRLSAGEPAASALIARTQGRLLAHAAEAMGASLTRVRQTIDAQLADADSPLVRLVARMVEGLGSDLRQDAGRRERLDAWLHATVLELVTRHHDLVGQMVRASLDPSVLSDRALVDQIESKVGDDLQYIRLNGAIVGGAVGVALAALKLYVF